MSQGAAFFDLDRTLLRGASGPLITEALESVGLLPARRLPGEGVLYRAYDIFGETLPGITVARAAVLALRGQSPELVREAAEEAAGRLLSLVAPYAAGVVDQHRREGRPVVLATTTPLDLVAPFARRLGFDDVIATRYAAAQDGQGRMRYTGGLDGGFVWGRGKLAAVRRWAASHGVELAASWAYTDSVYDLPLLGAVGHPVAVNADVRLAAVAGLRRWPQLQLDAPPGVPKLFGVEPMDLLRALCRPELFPYARFDIAGTEHIPRHGPAIAVANHRSYFDVVALGLTVMGAGRNPRALGKREVFAAPLLGQAARLFGQIEVDRGATGARSMAQATEALQAGEVVVVLPQGTIPRGQAFFDPVLTGRTGAARLAARTRAPVIPIGVWGTDKVWPRSSRLPDITTIVHPRTVRVRVGPPVTGLEGIEPRRATRQIMAAIVALLPDEARRPVTPTEAEVARATPPGGES